jgi:hypothetical protein
MSTKGFYSPLKIGLLLLTIAYFLFTFHATFTLNWIGEWNRIGGGFRFAIFAEDVTAGVCLVFRLVASVIALSAVIYYFLKKQISQNAVYRIVRIVIILEAIYWLGLSATTYFTVQGFARLLAHPSIGSIINSLVFNVIPSVVEAIILPIALLILAYKLSPTKSEQGIIRWSLISGMLYVLSFWLVYTSIWEGVIRQKGLSYVTIRPESAITFGLTSLGLVALALYIAYFAIKSRRINSIGELKIRTVAVIILALGAYFLWNYVSWVVLAGTQWNDWYAMFLGHNLDLWMLSLPFIALPLLLISIKGSRINQLLFAIEGIGAVFTGIFLSAYLAGIPTTVVYHSNLAARLTLAVTGIISLVLILLTIIFAIVKASKDRKNSIQN